MENEAKKRDFYDFCAIIERLRAPDGCPWDREQTHASLKKHMIEEAYEAAEALESGDGAKMADELGDVLLQVVLNAQIGKENGEFTIDDVTEAVCEKMVVHHPHIFSDVKADTSAEVLDNWEEIKRRERGGKSVGGTMDDVSLALPALTRAEKIYKKAIKAGLDTPFDDGSNGIGLLRETARLVALGLDPEEELRKTLLNFINFFKKFEENT